MSEDQLSKLFISYEEALEYWLLTLGNESSQIKAAKVENPLEELSKTTQLVKAHTTKVGIIFKKETLAKETQTACNTLQKLSESSILLVSVVSQLTPDLISKIFYEEIVNFVRLLLTSLKGLVKELKSENKNARQEEQEAEIETTGGDRLISVGMVWTNCDNICSLLKKGKLGLLTQKMKQGIEFIDDGLDDFEEWAEDPQEMGDDPFGEFSDEEEDDDESSDKEPPITEDYSELSKYSLFWLNKFKLIKLLLSSITKSLPLVTSAETINTIYSTQIKLIASIDKLILSLMMNMEVDEEESKELTDDIVRACKVLVKEVKAVNKQNENKVKWCVAWDSKFKEGL